MTSYGLDPIDGHPLFRDTDAPDIKADPLEVSVYAGRVGTRPIGTTAERDAYPFPREGLRWGNLTTKRDDIYRDGAWRAFRVGIFGSDGNASVASSVLEMDEYGKITLRATTARTNGTTYNGSVILGQLVDSSFWPLEEAVGVAVTYGDTQVVNAARVRTDGIVQLASPAPAGHTGARFAVDWRR